MSMSQQASSFKELMRQSLAFLTIASRAGRNEITDIIRRNVRSHSPIYSIGVLNVELVAIRSSHALLKFTATIIATVTMAFEHISDLCRRITSLDRPDASTSQSRSSSITFTHPWLLIICFVVGAPAFSYFWMVKVENSLVLLVVPGLLIILRVTSIGLHIGLFTLLYPWATFVGVALDFAPRFLMNFLALLYLWATSPCSAIGLPVFLYIRSTMVGFLLSELMASYLRAAIALFTVVSFVFSNFGAVQVFLRILSFLFTYFRMLVSLSLLPIATFFALASQTILLILITVEKLRSCRMPLPPFRTGAAHLLRDVILGYTITHGMVPSMLSISSRLWHVSSMRRAIICPHYSINPPVKQHEATCISTFYSIMEGK